MQITVTREHVKNGEQEDCNRCPMALALLEQVPGCDGANVDSNDILITSGDKRFVFVPSIDVREFIERFDGWDSEEEEWDGGDETFEIPEVVWSQED